MDGFSDREFKMVKIQQEGLELFKKKNQDYGDAFANYGVIGVLVRTGDKISRLQSITTKQISLINTESLRDTLIDLHNYSAMAIMLLDEDKKKNVNSGRLFKGYLSAENNCFDLLKKNTSNNLSLESNIFRFRG
tara:strand:- start:4950 stop:5351 length:402 start_codon:yes stop_codon:yes gene_type:complete